MAPIIHVIDPDGAREYLLRACARNEEMGNAHNNSTTTMFLALQELRSGDTLAAARWARRSLELCVEVVPSYVAQTTDAIVAIVKRGSPSDAAVLLGALRAPSRPQTPSRARRARSTPRRVTRPRFGERSATSSTSAMPRVSRSTKTEMIALAFTQLDAITQTHDRAKGVP